MLAERKEHYEKQGTQLKENTGYAKLKQEFDFLSEVDSQALAQEWVNLNKAYSNFFRGKGKVGFPKFKSKRNDRKSYRTLSTTNRLENGVLTIAKLKKVKFKQHRAIPPHYKATNNFTIIQNPQGDYYVSIVFEYDDEIKQKTIENIIGLDFSMSELYINSNGEKPEFPKPYRNGLMKLAKMQRKLSKMKKFSNNYYKQRRKIAKYHEYISNSRKDFLHKQSRQIANVNDCVVVESLNMKDMSRALNFGKSVHDNGWGMFVTFLDYKLKEQGKVLIKIDKWFPSSKTCSSCKTINKELTLSDRTYICNCGCIMDRDINAAINIKNEGLRLLNTA